MLARRTLAAVVLLVAGGLVGGAVVAVAAPSDPCNAKYTGNTIASLKAYEECRLDRIEAKIGTLPSPSPSVTPSASPTPTATPTPSATPTPTPSPTATPAKFPDATNTGVPKGTTLTAYTGPMEITAANTTITGKKITGRLTVRAENFTLRNSQVTTGDYFALMLYGKNALIEDSTFDGAPLATNIVCWDSGQFVARRLNISGGDDGISMNNDSTLEASYIHDLSKRSGAHNDAVNADGLSGVKIIGNTLLNANGQTSAIYIGDPRYGDSSVELRGNLLGGGGYTVYAGPGTSVVTGNQFTTRYFPTSGFYGPVAYWTSASGTWSGNTWADGPNAGKAVEG